MDTTELTKLLKRLCKDDDLVRQYQRCMTESLKQGGEVTVAMMGVCPHIEIKYTGKNTKE